MKSRQSTPSLSLRSTALVPSPSTSFRLSIWGAPIQSSNISSISNSTRIRSCTFSDSSNDLTSSPGRPLMHSMLRGNPLGWPVAACGSVAGHLPGCLPAWTRLAVVHLVRFGLFRFALVCFGLVGSSPEAALHLQERRQQWTFGIRDSALATRNWQLATGNLQRRWAFLFLQILFNYFSSWSRSRTQ